MQKGVTATVELSLRALPGSSRTATIPLETASSNKEMGRVLIRRGGETIAAGQSPLSCERMVLMSRCRVGDINLVAIYQVSPFSGMCCPYCRMISDRDLVKMHASSTWCVLIVAQTRGRLVTYTMYAQPGMTVIGLICYPSCMACANGTSSRAKCNGIISILQYHITPIQVWCVISEKCFRMLASAKPFSTEGL